MHLAEEIIINDKIFSNVYLFIEIFSLTFNFDCIYAEKKVYLKSFMLNSIATICNKISPNIIFFKWKNKQNKKRKLQI